MVGGIPVSPISRAMTLVVADEHERWHANLFQASGMIVFLACQDKMEIVLEWCDAGHSDLEKFFDDLWTLGDEFLRPPCFDSVLANVPFKSFPHHVAAHGERNAVGARVRCAAGREDKLFDLVRMVQRQ